MSGSSGISRRDVGKLALAVPLAGVAAPASAQLTAATVTEIETRSLDELHKAALAEGGELLVYGGGDLPNGSAGSERAFNARFPGMKLRILTDRSKFHGVRIDNQLAAINYRCGPCLAGRIVCIRRTKRWPRR